MLKSMHIKNFTLFADADLKFGPQLNVFVGENGSGKTHLMKLAYSVLAWSATEGTAAKDSTPTKAAFQPGIAKKLVNVFKPDNLGGLARRQQGVQRCEVSIRCGDPALDIDFGFNSKSKSEVQVSKLPTAWVEARPVFFPTRELLTIYPGFVAFYDNHYLEFEETWRDTCALLAGALKKGPREELARKLLPSVEEAMGGRIELEQTGRFYLVSPKGRLEIPLVSEGLRKLGMLAQLIANGSLVGTGYLFWDEPEANLNPQILKRVAKTILDVSRTGIQVFIATHSLFLLRELELLLQASRLEGSDVDARFFGLHVADESVSIAQGNTASDIGAIASLDEELLQSDRFLAPSVSEGKAVSRA